MRKANVSIREWLYSFLFYNVYSKKLAIFFLNCPFLVNNPIYRWFHNKYVKKIIARFKDSPNLVVIENTNLCNSHCSMCPHDVMKRKQGVMSEKVYRKIIDECVAFGVEKITLHNFGEPLMDRDFADKVRYAKKKGISCIGTSTNGALMTKELARNIISSGLDEINFSLDAYSKEAYEKIRVGLSYDQVMKNVVNFVETRNKFSKDKPMVAVDLIETEYNKNETGKFIDRWKGLVDKVNVTTLHTWGGSYGDKIGRSNFHSLMPKVKREPCRFLWTDMVINWDGRVSACCQDYEAKMVVGNVLKFSIKEIWGGKILNSLREKHLKDKMSEIPLCSRCDYRSVWWLFR